MWSDGQPLTARDVAFSFNYQKDLELTAFLSALDGIKTVTAPDDATVVIACDKPKADILVDVGAHRARARLERVQDLRRGDQVPQQSADRRLGAVPGRRVGEGQVHPLRGQQGLLGRQAQGRRDHLPGLQEPGHAGPGPQAGRDRPRHQHPAGAGQGAAGARPASPSEACSQKAFDYLSFNCYEGPSLGNPVLKDVKFRQALNWAVDKDKLTALAYQTYADPATSIFEVNFYDPNLGLALGAAGRGRSTPSTSRRPGRRSPTPATRTPTATAS